MEKKQAHAQQRAYSNPTRSQMQHTVIGRQPYNSYNSLPMGQIGAQQQPQQPPPLVRAQPQNHMYVDIVILSFAKLVG